MLEKGPPAGDRCWRPAGSMHHSAELPRRTARITGDLVYVDAMFRLEPDPVPINQADDRNGHIEQTRSEARYPLERTIGWRIENVIATKNLKQAILFGARKFPWKSCLVLQWGLTSPPQ